MRKYGSMTQERPVSAVAALPGCLPASVGFFLLRVP